jgi:hypothetical protein
LYLHKRWEGNYPEYDYYPQKHSRPPGRINSSSDCEAEFMHPEKSRTKLKKQRIRWFIWKKKWKLKHGNEFLNCFPSVPGFGLVDWVGPMEKMKFSYLTDP